MIPWAKPNYWGNERDYMITAIDSLWISDGIFIKTLETEFSKKFNRKVLTTSNGTSSLNLIYNALGLNVGDEVIVPGFCFLAAANVALQLHLKPTFVEVDKSTWCLDPNDLESKITNKTKVIVPVHTYGNVCEMNIINEIAKKYNLIVLEDCAESLFSKYDGKYSGTLGDVGSFSFQATKTITTGEGGMVITSDAELYYKMFLIRSHGLPVRGDYTHALPGHNFRLTNIQAAMGCGQLECIEEIKRERKRVYDQYLYNLKNEEGITFQKINSNVEPVIWSIAIYIDEKIFNINKSNIIEKLKNLNIETRSGFISSSLLNIYEKHKLNVCEDLSKNILSLPSYPKLTNDEIYYVCDMLKKLKK